MSPQPWEVWKARPPGFERDHWFVIVSPVERCNAPRQRLVNGLACFSLRGQPGPLDVRLNGADGFDAPTICAVDLFFALEKSALKDRVGTVCFERQQQIRQLLKAAFRL